MNVDYEEITPITWTDEFIKFGKHAEIIKWKTSDSQRRSWTNITEKVKVTILKHTRCVMYLDFKRLNKEKIMCARSFNPHHQTTSVNIWKNYLFYLSSQNWRIRKNLKKIIFNNFIERRWMSCDWWKWPTYWNGHSSEGKGW